MVRRVLSIVAVVGLVAAALVLGATPAGAGAQWQFEVTKTVEGPGADGPYTVNVSCDPAFVTPTPSTFDLNDGDTKLVTVDTNGTCTVTETATQGAAAVNYECTELIFSDCMPDGQSFLGRGDGVLVRIDITNTFPAPAPAPPPAAAAIPAAPTFTG